MIKLVIMMMISSSPARLSPWQRIWFYGEKGVKKSEVGELYYRKKRLSRQSEKKGSLCRRVLKHPKHGHFIRNTNFLQTLMPQRPICLRRVFYILVTKVQMSGIGWLWRYFQTCMLNTWDMANSCSWATARPPGQVQQTKNSLASEECCPFSPFLKGKWMYFLGGSIFNYSVGQLWSWRKPHRVCERTNLGKTQSYKYFLKMR